MKPLCIIFASSILSLHHYQHFTIMTSINLNQELFRQLSLIAGDEKLMRKTIEAIKLIVKQAKHDETEMSREEFMTRVAKANRGKAISFKNVEEIDKYVRS